MLIDLSHTIHATLLGADIAICEHMTSLAAPPDPAFRFFAAPVKLAGFGPCTVRAFARPA